LIVVLAFSWGMLKYGVPMGAKAIAYTLPQNIMQSATETTLKLLDDHYLEPSELDEAEKQRIAERFNLMSQQVEQGFNYQLQFRKGGEMLGANAFALPSGTIVMTDELVAIANNDEELLAVLAHELGHVVHRHSLRQVLQNSAISLVITYATGDISSLIVALPVLFVQLGYSRDFEHEADQFAYDFMQQQGIPLPGFANILEGLETAHLARREKKEQDEKSDGSTTVVDIFEYLSTHPSTEERVKRFRDVE
ncbi:MAG TPA: M48 family metallopeptidase, partial [Ectothiorhodospiraceae bacterium]|nr:M48 family metallopeptidase [Ectothiorhodospiraceae bacterium]